MVVVSICSTFPGICTRTRVSVRADACTSSPSSWVLPVHVWLGFGRRQYRQRMLRSKIRAIEDLMEDRHLGDGIRLPRTKALLASEMLKRENGQSASFVDARSEEEMLSCIQKEVDSGKLSYNVAMGMEELYYNYRNAVLQSGNPSAEEIVLSNMAIVLDRILVDVQDPFTFPPYHKAIREPFDYYMFGQNYIRPLVDFRQSYVGNISLFHEVEKKLQQGHNIILVANHQTEADPALIALLVEATNPHVAVEMTYVAGDRVVTDPLCKPFSMGRNLICVYSKKHLLDIPELVEMKKRTNTRSLKALALLLRDGGRIIWIAPSGGRDRPDPITGEWWPAQFDASSVDNIRRLAEHSSVPGHIYPLTLLCHDVMPPPPQVEKKIGEQRNVSFHGVGLSLGCEVSFGKLAAEFGTYEEAKMAFSQALYSSVTEQYSVLKSAIYKHEGLHASNSFVSLSQPWEES